MDKDQIFRRNLVRRWATAESPINSLISSFPLLRRAVRPNHTYDQMSEESALPEAPVFHPTEEEFRQPLVYIGSIRKHAQPFGICRIVPPKARNLFTNKWLTGAVVAAAVPAESGPVSLHAARAGPQRPRGALAS